MSPERPAHLLSQNLRQASVVLDLRCERRQRERLVGRQDGRILGRFTGQAQQQPLFGGRGSA